ncbi:SLC13 family permease [Salinithrix halophila]|uniref:Sodium-dependent dicarboxylate transporter SdcS n=2 Tax=Salinithrix halophila TaxID=1485204 RepID=A0ABV8JCB1_9BACL
MWTWNHELKATLRLAAGMASSSSGRRSPAEKQSETGRPPFYSRRQRAGLLLGPFLFLLTLLVFSPEGMSPAAQKVLACTLWISVWWITEAIPIPATSLLPIILFPLTGALEIGETTSAYGDPNIFLFLGGFMIALTMEKWNLHKRMALGIISRIGTQPQQLILGSMVATSFLSMWISNTATAMMMAPIGMAVTEHFAASKKSGNLPKNGKDDFPFGTAMMLGIAYSASIGGLGTLIGTPPNAIFAAQAEKLFNVEISFATWMLFGIPLVVVMLASTWFYLVKVAYPMPIKPISGGRTIIQQEKNALGRISPEEKAVLTVFILTALSWMTKDLLLKKMLPGIDDTVIAIGAALLLFLIPSRRKPGQSLLDWDTAKNIPWGILLLFGGGLALAAGITRSGLDKWIGEQLTVLSGLNILLILVVVITLVNFLTEVTSNTATATMMFPIMAAFAVTLGIHPYGLMVPAGIAASCAFMLPVATPPNAVVFASGSVRIGQMVRTGLWLNLVSILLITVAVYFLLPVVWGFDLMSPLKEPA